MNMVNSRGLWFYASLAGTVAGLTLGGCTQQKAESAPAAKPAPAPAASPAAKPEAPKPAPAMAAPGTQYWPTGRRESSAIAVEKIAPAEVSAGQAFDYTLRVTNLTSSVVENVVVTDTTDANFKPTGAVPAPQSSGNTHTFGLGKMNPGEVKDIKITGSATGVGSGILTNCASVTFTLPLCVTTKVVQPALAVGGHVPLGGRPPEARDFGGLGSGDAAMEEPQDEHLAADVGLGVGIPLGIDDRLLGVREGDPEPRHR